MPLIGYDLFVYKPCLLFSCASIGLNEQHIGVEKVVKLKRK